MNIEQLRDKARLTPIEMTMFEKDFVELTRQAKEFPNEPVLSLGDEIIYKIAQAQQDRDFQTLKDLAGEDRDLAFVPKNGVADLMPSTIERLEL